MKIKTKIELNEADLLEVLAKHFDLDLHDATIDVYKYDGDQRDPSYVKITIEATKK